MNPIVLVKGAYDVLFNRDSRYKRSRWTFLGADGRVLDVAELGANHIGQSVQLAAPPVGSTNQSQSTAILDVRAENPANPEIITVNFSVDIPGGTGTNEVIPQAHIIWGAGGAVNDATVDIVKGTQITVAASLLQIEGIYFMRTSAATPQIRVSANLSYGQRGGSEIAPGFTSMFDLAAAGGADNILIPVPNFAKDLTVYSQVAAETPADIKIGFVPFDGGTGTRGGVTQNEAAAPNTAFPRVYPIPGYTRRIKITNLSAAAITGCVRFGLAL